MSLVAYCLCAQNESFIPFDVLSTDFLRRAYLKKEERTDTGGFGHCCASFAGL